MGVVQDPDFKDFSDCWLFSIVFLKKKKINNILINVYQL